MTLDPKVLDIVYGVVVTLISATFIYLVKSYFDKIREAIIEIDKKTKQNSQDSKAGYNSISRHQRDLELSVNTLQSTLKELSRDLARMEGAQTNMQIQLSEVIAKVEKATGRLDAAFRFIDGANKRASDFGG